jgi:hypothetical protein
MARGEAWQDGSSLTREIVQRLEQSLFEAGAARRRKGEM